MSEETRRILILEQQNREQARAIVQLRDGIARLEGQLALAQGGGGGGSGGGGCYFIDPVVIGAAGSLAGQTVRFLSAGGPVTFAESALIYNIMGVGTSDGAGQYIWVLPNGDGSFSAITQGCPGGE